MKSYEAESAGGMHRSRVHGVWSQNSRETCVYKTQGEESAKTPEICAW